MASVLRAPSILLAPNVGSMARSSGAPPMFSFRRRPSALAQLKHAGFTAKCSGFATPFKTFASAGETVEAEETAEAASPEDSDNEIDVENGGEVSCINDVEDKVASVLVSTLQSYKRALENDNQSTIAEIEAFLLSIEEEKISLEKQVASSSKDLSVERDRILRISADFDNFRKRTERERLSMMSNVQGEVLESLLPVLDNFERAKSQIKAETEGEEKINNSYQSIYKQSVEVLTSLGVEAVETVGKEFDPLLHEAIMREESGEFKEGVIIQEFRKGFKIGDRLLRPSMVKVSAGPSPATPEEPETSPVIEGNSGSNEESPN